MKNDVFDMMAAGCAEAVQSCPAPAQVPPAQVASLAAQLIGYGLSRHVPAMQDGFDIITGHGRWRVDGALAVQMAELMRLHLMKQLETV
ncbi:hypothetical protein [Comamonas testosteroni]|uniref:hypothetical protein n=1 Tax=Comamonas testosteroni TaxID=285 RepID=UPI0005B4599F|nr:hypothetical protein [Comamonas testosteroni]